MPKASEKKLELILNYSNECPKLVNGDAGRIRQILMNLVGNSLKFTDSGHVIIQINPVPPINDKTVNLEFSVIDTGIGIAEDKQQKLFESFTQADGSTTRKYGGTGLGLSISKQLIELMGGTIRVDSKPGIGSRFYFSIQLPVVENRHYLKQHTLLNQRVLIVDDHSINLHVLRNQLQHFGMKVTVATDHEQALNILHNANVTKTYFNLIILDYLMPVIDGAELGKMIIDDKDIPDCPLVIYSSAARKGEMKKFEKIGFSGYLTKPALSEVLHDTLECILGEFKNTPSGDSGIITKYDVIDSKSDDILSTDFNGIKVLLAEDNQVNQKVAISLLEKHNIQVFVANNGQEAIDIFKHNEFDVVLMDCQMPIKDGFEASEEINNYQIKKQLSIPIIALTANIMQSDKDRCLNAGMLGFVAKPFTAETLLSSIQQILNQESPLITEKNIPQVTQKNKLLDMVILSSLKEAMEDDFAELLPAFSESSKLILADLWKAQESQQFEILQRNAHSLKSSSANLGAIELSSMAQALELQSKNSITVEPDQLKAIEEEYARVEQALLDFSSD